MSRKLARETAMKSAYALMLGGESTSFFEQEDERITLDKDDSAFVEDVLNGLAEHSALLDEWVSRYAIGWSIERIPKVDLCILRIALYEMIFRGDISHSVSINEAVELAKRFGGDKSPGYINGVLGSVSQAL